jgi:hypothetical protein
VGSPNYLWRDNALVARLSNGSVTAMTGDVTRENEGSDERGQCMARVRSWRDCHRDEALTHGTPRACLCVTSRIGEAHSGDTAVGVALEEIGDLARTFDQFCESGRLT